MAISPSSEHAIIGMANARLIAAAPDLLEALRLIAAGLPAERAVHRFFAAQSLARAAISCAIGEQV